MKICIHIPGSVHHGLWSPERGESRWAQNWAKLFAEQGHEVVCEATPGDWGACPVIPNVTLTRAPLSPNSPYVQGKEYDIYINPCWWKDRDIGGVKAKVYMHLYYGFNDTLVHSSNIPPNHVVVFPYKQGEQNFIHDNNTVKDRTFLLPTPLVEEFGENHFDCNAITFSAKDVFLNRYPEDSPFLRIGIDTIKAMIALVNKYKLLCNFCNADQLSSRFIISGAVIRRLKVDALIETAPNRTMHELMPFGMMMDLIEKSKILLPVISPGGAQIEGVALGVMPLLWAGTPFEAPARKHDFLLTAENATYDKIYNHIDRLLTDHEFYNNVLIDCQQELTEHLYSNCLDRFNNIITWSKAQGYL